MKNLKYYYYTIITYDLVNKFQFRKIKKIPHVDKVIVRITPKNNELKQILIALAALELISTQKAIPVNAQKARIILKMQKGNIAGCKITLKKNIKYNFFHRLIVEIFPKAKQFTSLKLNKSSVQHTKIMTFSLKNILSFPELEMNYHYFASLSDLNITIVTNTNKFREFIFLLKSLKFPFSE